MAASQMLPKECGHHGLRRPFQKKPCHLVGERDGEAEKHVHAWELKEAGGLAENVGEPGNEVGGGQGPWMRQGLAGSSRGCSSGA